MPRATVEWRVVRGKGTVTPGSGPTNALGVAAATWVPGPSADTQVVSVGVRGVGSVELRTSVTVATVTVLPGDLRLWPGDGLALRADLADAAGHPLSGGVVRWESADSTTARVGADGLLTAVRAGTTRVMATAGEATGASSVVVRPAVAGRLFTVDGAAPPTCRVVVRSGRRVDSVGTSADGRFALRLLDFPDDSVDVTIVPAEARHWGARLRVRSARELGELRVVLLPTTWPVSGGRYAGREVAISPAAAVARAADGTRFWRLERAEPRATWVPAAWRRAMLPVQVAFRAGPAGGVSADDSAAFWAITRSLERELDATIFAAARAPGGDADEGMIHVVVDPSIGDPGYTVASWNASGAIGAATVILRSSTLLSDATVVTHELLHALGVGHTSAWPSLMAPGGKGSASLTAADAAYVQLLLRLRQVQEENDAPYGVIEAASAERGDPRTQSAPSSRDRSRLP